MAKSIVVEAQEIFDKAIGKHRDAKGNVLLTTSKLRNFLNEIIRINNKVEVLYARKIQSKKKPEIVNNNLQQWEAIQREIEFLDIKLMYQVGREKNDRRDKVPYPVLDFYKDGQMHDRIKKASESPEEYERFADLIEAIVAIHKYNGGRD